MADNKINKETVSLVAMYRNLITRLKELIVVPRKEWRVIKEENFSINEVLGQFSLPLIGMYTAAIFIGYLLSHQGFNFEIALKKSVFTFSSYFFGLYLGYFILSKVMVLFHQKMEKEQVFKLVAFPSVIMYLVGTITALFPETYFVGYFVNLYLVYLVWVGIDQIGAPDKEAHVWQTVLFSAVILFVPMLIQKLLVFISEITL